MEKQMETQKESENDLFVKTLVTVMNPEIQLERKAPSWSLPPNQ